MDGFFVGCVLWVDSLGTHSPEYGILIFSLVHPNIFHILASIHTIPDQIVHIAGSPHILGVVLPAFGRIRIVYVPQFDMYFDMSEMY